MPGIHLGTAVVPTYPRHPHAMAQQAMTAWDATDGHFTLGIGLSHQIVIETMFGMSFDRPAVHMREYLSVLLPLLREGNVVVRRRAVPRARPARALGPRRSAAGAARRHGAGDAAARRRGRRRHDPVDDRGRRRSAEHVAPRVTKAAADGRRTTGAAGRVPRCRSR